MEQRTDALKPPKCAKSELLAERRKERDNVHILAEALQSGARKHACRICKPDHRKQHNTTETTSNTHLGAMLKVVQEAHNSAKRFALIAHFDDDGAFL